MEVRVKTLPYTIDRGSYVKARVALLIRRLAIKIGIFSLIVPGLLLLGRIPSLLTFALEAISLFLYIFAIVVGILLSRIFGRKYRPMMDAVRHVELTDSTVFVSAESFGESNLSWNMFTGVETVGGWTFLIQHGNPIVVIPDQAFATPGDRQTFKTLLDQKRPTLGKN